MVTQEFSHTIYVALVSTTKPGESMSYLQLYKLFLITCIAINTKRCRSNRCSIVHVAFSSICDIIVLLYTYIHHNADTERNAFMISPAHTLPIPTVNKYITHIINDNHRSFILARPCRAGWRDSSRWWCRGRPPVPVYRSPCPGTEIVHTAADPDLKD